MHRLPDVMFTWHSVVGNIALGTLQGSQVVVVILVVTVLVVVLVRVAVTVLVLEVFDVVTVMVPKVEVVVSVVEVSVRLVDVSVVDVVFLVVAMHAWQPQHVSQVHSVAHPFVLVRQDEKHVGEGVVVVGGIVPGSEVGMVLVVATAPVVTVVAVSVNVVISGYLRLVVSAAEEDSSTGGSSEVGMTTLAHGLQVPHTGQPHLMNQGCELMGQYARHSGGTSVVVVVVEVPRRVTVVEVLVMDVVVVVVVHRSEGGASATKSSPKHSTSSCSTSCCTSFRDPSTCNTSAWVCPTATARSSQQRQGCSPARRLVACCRA